MMRYNKSFYTLILAVTLGAYAVPDKAQSQTPAILTEKEAGAFLTSMSDSLSSIETLQADFVQKRYLAVFMDTLVSSGSLYFEMPDNLRWEVKEAFHTILITSGGRVAKFDFQDDMIRKLKIGAQDLMQGIMEQIIFWMKGDFSASSAMYTITVERYGNHSYIIKLEPKSSGMRENLSLIALYVSASNYHIIQVALHETGMGITRIFFTGETVNRPFDARLFDLNSPLLQDRPAP